MPSRRCTHFGWAGALWRCWGIEPVAVWGQLGEYAAAHLAGMLTLEDGAR